MIFLNVYLLDKYYVREIFTSRTSTTVTLSAINVKLFQFKICNSRCIT